MDDESNLPRHARLGEWLAANPVEGVEAIDRIDGLGPRAVGWPRGRPAPDVEAWARVHPSAATAAQQADADRLVRRQQDAAEAESFGAIDANWSAVNLAGALLYIRRLLRATVRLEQRIRDLEARLP
jgi:hypothetical protein